LTILSSAARILEETDDLIKTSDRVLQSAQTKLHGLPLWGVATVSFATSNLLTIDKATGQAKLVAPLQRLYPLMRMIDIACTPDGEMYGLVGILDKGAFLVAIDPATGGMRQIGGPVGSPWEQIVGLAADTGGDLLALYDNGTLALIDKESAEVDPIGQVEVPRPRNFAFFDFAIAPDGSLFATGVKLTRTSVLVKIDGATLKGTQLGDLGSPATVVAFDADGTLYGASEDSTLIRIDTTSALGTAVGEIKWEGSRVWINGIAFCTCTPKL
jgi:hypothetical protein